jgi:hypothetical protein
MPVKWNTQRRVNRERERERERVAATEWLAEKTLALEQKIAAQRDAEAANFKRRLIFEVSKVDPHDLSDDRLAAEIAALETFLELCLRRKLKLLEEKSLRANGGGS